MLASQQRTTTPTFGDKHPPTKVPYRTGSAEYSFYFNSLSGSGTTSPQVTVTFPWTNSCSPVKFHQTLKNTQPTGAEDSQTSELKPQSNQFQEARISLKNNPNLPFLQLIIVILATVLLAQTTPLEPTVLEGSSQSAKKQIFSLL